jgi:hypothetical protein
MPIARAAFAVSFGEQDMRLAVTAALAFSLLHPALGEAAGHTASHATSNSVNVAHVSVTRAAATSQSSASHDPPPNPFSQQEQAQRALIAGQQFLVVQQGTRAQGCMGSEWSANGQHRAFQSGCSPQIR